jgi:2-methylisocitrate lyase-like PEP mutase family enzyme
MTGEPIASPATKARRMRELVAAGGPLISPGAHDALSARLLEAEGFPVLSLGGSVLLAARLGLPDIGLAGFAEMLECTRSVVTAIEVPCIADADDGYGDIPSVVRTVHAYESVGVAALVLEDQERSAKRPGDSDATRVTSAAAMATKLRAAVAHRQCPDTLVVARTDCYATEGIDGVLRRCEAYLTAGADGLLASGLASREHLSALGAAFPGVYKLVVQVEGSRTPWLAPRELHAMGFAHIAYPTYLMNRLVSTLQRTSHALLSSAQGDGAPAALGELHPIREALDAATRLAYWRGFSAMP